MAKKKGFAADTKETKTKKDYITIFEKIEEKAKGKEQSPAWYRRQLKSIAMEYVKHPEHLIRNEKRDQTDPEENQDKNHIRKFAKQGRLFFFEYEAKMKNLPYYDTFPLVYVIHTTGEYFYGANLHYLHPKRRPLVIEKLKDDRIDIPKICFHKYIRENVKGFMLDLASSEWETAIALPVEHFITDKSGKITVYKPSDVWAETQAKYYDKLKTRRIIKGYGKPSDIEEVE